MAWLRLHARYLQRRIRRLWAIIAAHHHGSTFAVCALCLMAASMVTSIEGWTGLLPRTLAVAVGTGGQLFLLYFAILLVSACTRLARLLLLAVLAGFALTLSVPFSWTAIVAGNAERAEVSGREAIERQALTAATHRFVAEGNAARAQVMANIENARAWLGRTGAGSTTPTPPPGRLLVEEVPPGAAAEPAIPPSRPGPPPTPASIAGQRRYLDEMERVWQDLPLSPDLTATGSVDAGWRNLSAAYGRLMVVWGRTRIYLRERAYPPAVPLRPVAGYAEAAAGVSDPINRAFHRLLNAPRPADGWFLLLALMLDAAPIWAAWTLSLVTPSKEPNGNGGEGPFERLREDLHSIEERLAESGPASTDHARYERDTAWDFALSLSVQRLFLDALETWWTRVGETVERTDADPALEGRFRTVRDAALEDAARPVRHLRQALWLLDTKHALALAREAQDMERDLGYLGDEAVAAAKRRLAGLLAP